MYPDSSLDLDRISNPDPHWILYDYMILDLHYYRLLIWTLIHILFRFPIVILNLTWIQPASDGDPNTDTIPILHGIDPVREP